MESFLKEIIEGEKFELLIDTNIFKKSIILKSAYNFLDRGYFFFKTDKKSNIILQFTKKEGNNESPKNIIADFSDELLSVYLRDKLEQDNKNIREMIVWAAISNSLDSNSFVSLDTNNPTPQNWEINQIDFDKDIDEILREIENDPDLKIDEEEIERILKEIEAESNNEIEIDKNQIKLDKKWVENQKKKFKK